jgi:hypothetical protein
VRNGGITATTLAITSAAGGAGKMQLATTMSDERRRKIRDLFNQRTLQLDSEDAALKTMQQKGVIIMLPFIFLNESKTGKMVYGVLPNLAAMRALVDAGDFKVVDHDEATGEVLVNPYLEVVIDMRTRERIKKDEADGLKMEDQTIHRAEDIKDMLDPNGDVRRVAFRYTSTQVCAMNNKSGVSDLSPCTFCIVRLEPSAWVDYKKTQRIGAMTKLVSIVQHHPMPADAFVAMVRGGNCWTKQIRTKVVEYKTAMEALSTEHGADIPKEAKNAVRYRNDNEFLFMLGFSHGEYIDAASTEPTGLLYRDMTDPVDGNLEGTNGDTKKKENRYQMELRCEQWEHDPSVLDEETGEPEVGYPTGHPERIVTFFTKIAFWKEQVDRLGITSLSGWKLLAPINIPYLRALVFAREDADVTYMNGLTHERLEQIELARIEQGDACTEDINKATGNGRASFYLGLTVSSYLFSPETWVGTIGIPVSPGTIVKHLWDSKTMPKVEGDLQGAPTLDMDKSLICLSEIKMDVKRVLSDPNFKFYVVTNIYSQDPDWSQDHFGQVLLAEGDQLVEIFANLHAKKASIKPEKYAETRKWTLGPQHLLRKFQFVHGGSRALFYVFALNMKRIKDTEATFMDFVNGLGRRISTAAPGSSITFETGSAVPLLEMGSAAATDEPAGESGTEAGMAPPPAKRARVAAPPPPVFIEPPTPQTPLEEADQVPAEPDAMDLDAPQQQQDADVGGSGGEAMDLDAPQVEGGGGEEGAEAAAPDAELPVYTVDEMQSQIIPDELLPEGVEPSQLEEGAAAAADEPDFRD